MECTFGALKNGMLTIVLALSAQILGLASATDPYFDALILIIKSFGVEHAAHTPYY